MKPISMVLKIALLLSLCLSSSDIFAAGDDFCVRVEEKPTTGSIAEPADVCIPFIDGGTMQCFEVLEEGNSIVNVKPSFYWNISSNPPIGSLFQVRGSVHILDGNGNKVYVNLTNGVPGQNYVIGATAASQVQPNQIGFVDLAITFEFDPVEACVYYFTFWLSNIVPPGQLPMHYPSLEGELALSTCQEWCIVNYPDITNICIEENQAPNNNTSNREFNLNVNSKSNLSVYPNPTADGNVILDIDFGQSSAEKMDIQVLDTQGRVVHVANNLQKQAKQKLSLTNLSPGIYFVYVQSGDQQLFEKIVKQ